MKQSMKSNIIKETAVTGNFMLNGLLEKGLLGHTTAIKKLFLEGQATQL